LRARSLVAQSAKTAGRDKFAVKDGERVDTLFMDIGQAADYLEEYEEKLMEHQ